MTKHCIATPDAPAAIGPYSQATIAHGFLFCSGQIPIDPGTAQVVERDVAVQTRQVLTNLRTIVEAAGAELSDVVKTTVFLRDLNDFIAMNKVYAEFFPSEPPARAAVQVARLPRDVAVEIEAVVALPER